MGTFDLFSNQNLIIYILLSFANAMLMYFSSLKFLLVLQQSGYHGTRYFKWINSGKRIYLARLMLLSMLAFMFFCVLNICFSSAFSVDIVSFVGFSAYLLFSISYIHTEGAVNAKVPLKKTKRLVRLCITYALVLTAFSFGLIVLVNYLSSVINDEIVYLLRYSLLCLTPLTTPILLIVAYALNEPFEEIIRRRYYAITTKKLDSDDFIKIGITGSYGKTSVKEILKGILSVKYRVLATPASYNTPVGMSWAVKNLDSTHDVFIAEMGARSKGDIKELVKIVKPTYGVLTGINSQHLETFKSIENIKDTKFELFEGLPEKGKGFFSSENEGAIELFERFNGKKVLAGGNGEKGQTVFASDVKITSKGTTFTLNVKGEEPIKCSTVLLGKHSIENICLASSVAKELGLSAEEIALGIGRLQSVGHRLELIPNNKNIVIIDDSYNANEDGVKASMEVLDTFEGRKIVLTPGLVELGKRENQANFEMGRLLAKHADLVIVIGNHNAEMLISGLLDGGMNKENVCFYKTLNKGNAYLNSIIKEGDVVLFENDLPDNYS